MKRTPLTAILTLLAILATTIAVAGCGGKSGSSSSKPTTTHHDHAEAQIQTGLLSRRSARLPDRACARSR